MKCKLTENQKDKLRKLFNGTDELMDTLFWNIEFIIRTDLLPPKGSRKSVIKEKITLLKEVAEASKKLRLLLTRLDGGSLEQIDMILGEKVGTKYEYESLAKSGIATQFTDNISSISAAKTIEVSSLDLASFYNENYTKTYSGYVLDDLLGLWPYWFEDKITLTEHSKFIKYISIVLNEDSTDKLVKQCKRSGFFEKHM